MTDKTTLLILTGLLWSTAVFSQDEIRVDIMPSKISTDIKMIIPIGQTLVLERYHFFKYNYWVSAFDTLEKLDNGMLQARGVVINPEAFKIKVNKCDTSINKVRNGALAHNAISDLRALSRKEIGYDNKEFNNSQSVGRPTEYQEKTLCNDDFKVINKKWFDEQVENIDEIRKKKIARQEWMKTNPEKIDKNAIKLFLEDYGSCDSDQIAISWIMMNKTNDFLSVCKEMGDIDFHLVKLKLSPLPDNLPINEIIKKMNLSPIKTNRKGKLVRALKKSLG